MEKPVKEVTVDVMWDYEYQAKRYTGKNQQILASNSLNNLKREVRKQGWALAWITCSNGSMSYGQSIVDEYPYKPRY